MRILIAHESAAGAGGVESYLAALMPALTARGHHVAFIHYNSRTDRGPTHLLDSPLLSASVADDGLERAVRKMRAWHPDVCFSHNMRALDVEERLAAEWPVIKMLHGYFGTCVSGQKAHSFPGVVPCAREFGAPCLALYMPRRCGQLRPSRMVAQYRWTAHQRTLLGRYSHLVVASAHMGAEYRKHGIAPDGLTVAPLFPTAGDVGSPRPVPPEPSVLFMGRMTNIKGAAVLAHAVAQATRRSRMPIRVVFAGEGPEQDRLKRLTRELQLDAAFPGWVTGTARSAALRAATLVAVPSLWPEPFGLVGLEAAAHGVPAVAFDVGGVREWLRHDESGRLVPERDTVMLGHAIAELCAAPDEIKRLGEGAQRVARTLSLDAHVGILERVFARSANARAAIA
jgi:glycosyltransferase involved in cell wall biosynthesis